MRVKYSRFRPFGWEILYVLLFQKIQGLLEWVGSERRPTVFLYTLTSTQVQGHTNPKGFSMALWHVWVLG